ncbi:MAG: hypothetical protein B6244_07860 [Candidatus Cloacimonetes bacterium 4572_55]|nr:MAG: hypothetical protein B6244_07860 [Candidatus Cloacimonetes bacterium 4572_55]
MTNQPKSTMNSQPVPIAVIGIGCIFPKARNRAEYWTNIKNGVDAITEVPPTHWDPADYYHSDPKKRDHVYGKHGGFLPPIDFNPIEFGILPNAIEAIDTTQTLSLVAAREALLDAGYGPDREFDRDRVSVILGVTGALEMVIPLGARLGHPIWRQALKEANIDDDIAEEVVSRISDGYVEWQENSFPGLLGNVAAGRIANRFDFGGTNCVVDAACASSLSAIHLAALELNAGRADMVLTGGADTFNHVFMYACFSKTPALSPGGHARSFDRTSDGTTLGEGVGIIAVKRLADAERDNDRIYAVIKGIGTSSDGKGNAVYAPSSEGQIKALQRAYDLSDVSPDTIELMEAHGTGTKVGDPIEVKSLNSVFGADAKSAWCALGTVKSQIGHTKAAAGAAGLIKIVQALHHKTLPPTIKVERPIDELAPGASPFYINTEKRPWLSKEKHPRRAAVSSFGFGGSNFHCVLEEYQPIKKVADWSGHVQILAYSDNDPAQIARALDKLDSDMTWDHIRRLGTKLCRKFDRQSRCRLLIAVDRDGSDMKKIRETVLDMLDKHPPDSSWNTPDGIYYRTGDPAGKLGIVFPGQGSQYVGMLRELACLFPQFQKILQAAGSVQYGDPDSPDSDRLSDLIYPHSLFTAEDRDRHNAVLRSTQVAQPSIGAVSLALLKVLTHFGVGPAAAAGHSYGELVALCAAGSLDMDAFFSLSKLRGQLMGTRKGDKGSMLAVQSEIKIIERVIAEEGIDLVIANKNAPRQTVLSGGTDEIKRAAKIFKARKMRCKQLNVAAAFHSRYVSDAGNAFLEALKKTSIQPPNIPVYSNKTATPYPKNAEEMRRILAGQLANPVEFVKIIEGMYADGVRTFLEAGPSSNMSGLVKSILKGKQFDLLSVDSSKGKQSGEVDLARVLSRLAAIGYPIQLPLWNDGEIGLRNLDSDKKPSITVTLTGANHFVKKSTPTRPRAKKKSISKPVPSNSDSGIIETPRQNPQPEPTPVTQSQSSASGDDMSEALRITQENLVVLQKFQQQTADLHRQFLEGQDSIRQTFDRLLNQQRQLLTGVPVSPQISEPPAPVPRQPDPPADPRPDSRPIPRPIPRPTPQVTRADQDVEGILLESVADKTGYPVDMLNLDMGLDSDLGIDSIKRVEILSDLQERLPHAPEVSSDQIGQIETLRQIVQLLQVKAQPSPQDEQTDQNPDQIERVLLESVADKTGYPVDMLNLDMGLDSDLGIDSIKRVEILSDLQERLPHAPEVSSDQIGQIETLRQIVQLLQVKAQPSPQDEQTDQNPDQVERVLLESVADKTGYPVDMLNLDMGLDSDLGIDSIKRVEILSDLQERLPHAPEVSSDQIGQIETLRQIANLLGGSAPAAKKNEISDQEQADDTIAEKKESHTVLTRQVLTAVPLNRVGISDEIKLPSNAVIWITEDGSDLGAEIVSMLRENRLEKGNKVQAELVSISRLPERVPKRLHGLIIIAPLDADDNFLKRAFRLMQIASKSLNAAAQSDAAIFLTVSRLDGRFGLSSIRSKFSAQGNPVSGGLAGLLKTADKEWDKVHCKAIDLANDFSDSQAAAEIVTEMWIADPLIEVGVAPGKRFRLEFEPRPFPKDPIASQLTPKDVILISGGARGVTAACAIELARWTQSKLALIGRSPEPTEEPNWLSGLTSEREIKRAIVNQSEQKLSPKAVEKKFRSVMTNREIHRTLSRILELTAQSGGTVLYRSVDVRDKKATIEVLKDIQKNLGKITALIHGAGVIADRRIEDKTVEQFDRVYDTKVIGLRNLLSGLGDSQLKALALFSSTTARFGRIGQADYAAANEVLNKIAQLEAQTRRGCRTVSINWGPWAGGMVTPSLEKLFEKEGVGLIPLPHGARYLAKEIYPQPGNAVETTVIAESSSRVPEPDKPTVSKPYSLTLERRLNIDQYPFLKSHVMNGKPVLPTAIIMEWLAHGALHNNPGFVFYGLNNLRILKGVVLESASPYTLQVMAGDAKKERDSYMLPVEMHGRNRADSVFLHADAEVILKTKHPQGKRTIRIRNRAPYPRSEEDIYKKYLFHGPDFQGIEKVESCSPDGIIATIKPAPDPSAWLESPLRSRWLTDPLMIDSSFQLMILWSFDQHGQGSLPTSIGRYRQFKSRFPTDGGRIVAQVTKNDGRLTVANIEFLNFDNELTARIEGYECVMDPSLKRAFKRNRLTD